MKSIATLVTIALLGATTAAIADSPHPEEAAIRKVIEDYGSGYYLKDAARVQNACHTQVSKHGLADKFWGRPFEHLEEITYEQLEWLANNYNFNDRLSLEESPLKIRIFDIEQNTASAEMIGADWMDFVDLGKINGEWKIINIVYGPVPSEAGPGTSEDETAIRTALTDYIMGYYTNDGDRCTGASHVQLDKRTIQKTRVGEEVLTQMRRDFLNYVGDNGNQGENRVDPETGRLDVEIFQIWGNIAQARVTAQTFYDYVQFVKIKGEWKMVNVLWGFTESQG